MLDWLVSFIVTIPKYASLDIEQELEKLAAGGPYPLLESWDTYNYWSEVPLFKMTREMGMYETTPDYLKPYVPNPAFKTMTAEEHRIFLKETAREIKRLDDLNDRDFARYIKGKYLAEGIYFYDEQHYRNYAQAVRPSWPVKLKQLWIDINPMTISKQIWNSPEFWRQVLNPITPELPYPWDCSARNLIDGRLNPRSYYFSREARSYGLDEETVHVKLLNGDFLTEGVFLWAPTVIIVGTFLWIAWDICDYDEEGCIID
jgi:hypothetical protein